MKNLSIYVLSGNNYLSDGENINDIKILGLSVFKWIDKNLKTEAKIIDAPLERVSELTLILKSTVPHISEAYVEKAIEYLVYRDKAGLRFPGGYLLSGSFPGSYEKLEKYESNLFDLFEITDVNSLISATSILNARINRQHLENGVYIEDPSSVKIDAEVLIEPGAYIYAFNVIKGASVIKSGAKLYSYNSIADSVIGEGSEVTASTLRNAFIGKNVKAGPYSLIRPGSHIGDNCRVGDFVEIKNSNIGDNTKIAHLAYVGDADVGSDCNIGCGAVFANYNGKDKFRTNVGDNVFIGCNCNLIAPLSVGSGTFIAAGTTVDKDTPEDAFAIGRSQLTLKEGGGKKYRIKR